MTDTPATPADVAAIRRPILTGPHLRRRYAAERRFRLYGLASIGLAGLMLLLLVGSIVQKGHSAFWQTYVKLDVTFAEGVLNPDGGPVDHHELERADYMSLVRDGLKAQFPEAAADRRTRRDLYGVVSTNADFALRRMVLDDPSLVGQSQ